jgi:hypothetical protein
VPHEQAHLTGAPGPRYLTKSEFFIGRGCHKRLWWTVHEPASQELVPESNAKAVMAMGRLVGATARDHVPGGRLIGPAYQGTEARLAATRRAMHEGAPAIYEAAFVADGLSVSVDILERVDDGWALVEVKSVLDVREPHTADAALQAHVLRRSGIDVRRVEVMHLNRGCRHPQLDDLFLRRDVTDQAATLADGLAVEAARQMTMLDGGLPTLDIGPHCEEHSCPFTGRCWPKHPEHHVSTMYYAGKQWWEWERQGYRTVDQLPDSLKLRGGEPALRQRRAIREGRRIVEGGLRVALDAFEPTLAFLDFETVRLPVPAWPGTGPLMHVPVQFSCHLANGDGRYTHFDWLADGPGDPRPALAERLVEACGSARAVVAYFARFEKDCLEHLAAAVPALATELRGIASRLVDLLPVVRDHVYDPAFGGSFSLKKVLPALVPGSGYGGLEIAEGETASHELVRLIFHGEAMMAQERAYLRENLLEYCRRDTLAMIQLLDRLRDLAA